MAEPSAEDSGWLVRGDPSLQGLIIMLRLEQIKHHGASFG